MAVCSIHYREYAWDNYEGCLDVRVNLTDLYLGNEALASEDAFEPDPQIRDITEQLSPAERRALFACLQRLRLGFVAEPLMGLDGADYRSPSNSGLSVRSPAAGGSSCLPNGRDCGKSYGFWVALKNRRNSDVNVGTDHGF